jgi:hypothetical protein
MVFCYVCFLLIDRCDSIDKLRSKLLQIEKDLSTDLNKFKDLYQFTFNFAKSSSQKSLDLEDAVAYWKMILADRFKYLDLWIQFLQVNSSKIRFQNWIFGESLLFIYGFLLHRNIINEAYRKTRGIYYSNFL